MHNMGELEISDVAGPLLAESQVHQGDPCALDVLIRCPAPLPRKVVEIAKYW